MRTHLTLFPALLLLILSGLAGAQPYQLDWEHCQTEVAPVERSYEDQRNLDNAGSPPPPTPRSALAPMPVKETVLPIRSNRSGSNLPPPTRNYSLPEHDIWISAQQWFDYERDKYILVDRVETTIFRPRGYPHSETHWNFGRFTEQDVFLNDLRPGDRYQVFVIWEDGSTFRQEVRITGFVEHRRIIDTPLDYTQKLGIP